MSEKKRTYLNGIGEIRKNRDADKGNYIVITKDVTLPKGAKIFSKTPQEQLDQLVERGVLTPEKAQERLEKTPDYVVKYLDAVVEA